MKNIKSNLEILMFCCTVILGIPSAAFSFSLHEWQLGLQEPATSLMSELHHSLSVLFIVMSVIVIAVLGLVVYTLIRFRRKEGESIRDISGTCHNVALEILWTAFPVLIVAFLSFGNLKLIKFQEDLPKHSDVTLKVIAHQWYWEYVYPEYGISFNSYLKEGDDLKKGDLRLLSVSDPIFLPVNANVKLQVTSADVIHSWAMPAFGVKIDAVPGRLNDTWFKIDKKGIYYGQCSEICGIRHGFMPIEVQAVSKDQFDIWVKKMKTKDMV